MMELFYLEHRKLWRRSSTRVCIFLCFLYVVVFGCILSYQWFTFGSSGDHTSAFGNNFDGYTTIRDSQEYSLLYGGELTDETLQRMVRDYQRMHEEGMEQEMEKTDWQTINSWLSMLWPELRESGRNQTMICYVDPERLTGFYERRQRGLEEFLEISGQTGEEREYLMQIEQRVETPFRYEWVEGWMVQLGSILSDMGMVMALFLAIALSPLFAGEWHSNTGLLILTTKKGWEKLALAKIAAGLCFALELFGLLAVGDLAAQLFFLGTAGWDMPVQNIKLISIAPMNMLQAEIYELGFAALGAVGFAGIVMLLSAAARSNVPALLLSLAVVYGPMMIDRYLPYGMQKALDLIPLVGSGADIFRTNTFCFFGRYIWSPYLLITVPVLLGMLCLPLAVKRWAGRLRA